MSFTTLKSPLPKIEVDRIASFEWPITSTQRLGRVPSEDRHEFLEVLSNRRSRRSFGAITETELGEFLFLANRTISRHRDEAGVQTEHHPVPSAGGLHVTQCLLRQPSDTVWSRYDPFHHQLERLSIASSAADVLPTDARGFFPNAIAASVIWYVADMTRLGASYFYPESLAWRDAGVLIANHALVAEYLGYAYCPLGITGVEEARSISNQRDMMGVGVALLGRAL